MSTTKEYSLEQVARIEWAHMQLRFIFLGTSLRPSKESRFFAVNCHTKRFSA